jgi:hypothetical protein
MNGIAWGKEHAEAFKGLGDRVGKAPRRRRSGADQVPAEFPSSRNSMGIKRGPAASHTA